MDITIKVLGEFDNVQTHFHVTSRSPDEIKRQLRQAIASLEAEIHAFEKCPYHGRAA